MSGPEGSQQSKSLTLSLDGWAVAVAFLLALLVRTGVLRRIPW